MWRIKTDTTTKISKFQVEDPNHTEKPPNIIPVFPYSQLSKLYIIFFVFFLLLSSVIRLIYSLVDYVLYYANFYVNLPIEEQRQIALS